MLNSVGVKSLRREYLGEDVGSFSRSEILDELERVSSITFGRKKSLEKMLRFIVLSTVDNKSECLKEFTIATLVFGKDEHFDPRMTSLVRTQAHKLRGLLAAHYRSHPSPNGPWLWIPAGSYRAVFHHNPGQSLGQAIGEDFSVTGSLAVPRLYLTEPVMFSRGSDLSDVSNAVLRFYREQPVWGEESSVSAEPGWLFSGCGSAVSNRTTRSDLEVKHTIVEVESGILLTACLQREPRGFVLVGHSFSLPWPKDRGDLMSHIARDLTAFLLLCQTLLSSQFPVAGKKCAGTAPDLQ